jgi:prephenate dehydrogenase
MVTDFPNAVTIYGTGLIGSSLGLAMRRCAPGIRIYGVDTPEILERARRLGVIEADDPRDSDLAILASPVGTIIEMLDRMRPGTGIILDVGSTKVEICSKAERLGLPFIGGHPMAGSERSGPEAAAADLFDGTRFFLCPVATTPAGAIERVERTIEAIGAVPMSSGRKITTGWSLSLVIFRKFFRLFWPTTLPVTAISPDPAGDL